MKDNMVFTALPAGSVHLKGLAGQTLERVIENRLKTVDYARMTEPFHKRNEDDFRWRCEFWGKVTRSAIFAWRGTGDKQLRRIIDDTVEDMLSTQTPDGRITTYPADKQLRGWDLWGRKYVLLTLLEYYAECGNSQKVLDAAIRLADDLLNSTGGNIQDYGEHYGLAASSILRALVMLYRFGGEKRHLDAATKLASIGCCHLHNIFKMATLGVPPAELSNGKAYEMTSCFQGLCELYKVTGDYDMLESISAYYRAVRDREIFITGSGGLKDANGEFWFHGKEHQVRHDCGGIGETCVTVTWMAFCRNVMELFGESNAADEFERSLYNAMIGAVSPDATNFTHINPFLDGTGYRTISFDQMARGKCKGFDGHDCCRAQGPYGLALAPYVAVMKSNDGYVVNLYENMEVDGLLRIEGGFPLKGNVCITIEKGGEYEILLRMPSEYGCKIDGVKQDAGIYASLTQKWRPGDKIKLEFDLKTRSIHNIYELHSKWEDSYEAYAQGPLVMAKDSRYPRKRIPFYQAGNAFSPENTFTVWHIQQD